MPQDLEGKLAKLSVQLKGLVRGQGAGGLGAACPEEGRPARYLPGPVPWPE